MDGETIQPKPMLLISHAMGDEAIVDTALQLPCHGEGSIMRTPIKSREQAATQNRYRLFLISSLSISPIPYALLWVVCFYPKQFHRWQPMYQWIYLRNTLVVPNRLSKWLTKWNPAMRGNLLITAATDR